MGADPNPRSRIAKCTAPPPRHCKLQGSPRGAFSRGQVIIGTRLGNCYAAVRFRAGHAISMSKVEGAPGISPPAHPLSER
jgi:hypothetical protein